MGIIDAVGCDSQFRAGGAVAGQRWVAFDSLRPPVIARGRAVYSYGTRNVIHSHIDSAGSYES